MTKELMFSDIYLMGYPCFSIDYDTILFHVYKLNNKSETDYPPVFSYNDKYIYFGNIELILAYIICGYKSIPCKIVNNDDPNILLKESKLYIDRVHEELYSLMLFIVRQCYDKGWTLSHMKSLFNDIESYPYIKKIFAGIRRKDKKDKFNQLSMLIDEGKQLREISDILDIKYCTLLSWLESNKHVLINKADIYRDQLISMKLKNMSYTEMAEKLNIQKFCISKWFKQYENESKSNFVDLSK